MAEPKPFEVEQDVPMPPRNGGNQVHLTAFRKLAAGPDGASMFIPWGEHNEDPDKEASHWQRMACRIVGKGRSAVRRVEGGFRVWKKAAGA
jgi:hypothetical protein